MKKHMQMLMLLADDFSIPGIFPQAQFKAKQVTNYTLQIINCFIVVSQCSSNYMLYLTQNRHVHLTSSGSK